MAKLGEIPQEEVLNFKDPDLVVVYAPDDTEKERPHYMPRQIITIVDVAAVYPPDDIKRLDPHYMPRWIVVPGHMDEFFSVSPENGATVAKSAQVNSPLGTRTFVGPQSTIGKDVTILDRTRIGRGVHVGDNSIFYEGVNVFSDVTIGKKVKIGAGARIHRGATIEDGLTIGRKANIPPGRRVTKDYF